MTGVAGVPDALGVPLALRGSTTVGSVAREPVYVPESLDLDGVLAALGSAGADLAIVVDEYGGTDGVVTTEDLVEELVGEIADEFDPDAVDDVGPAELVSDGRRPLGVVTLDDVLTAIVAGGPAPLVRGRLRRRDVNVGHLDSAAGLP